MLVRQWLSEQRRGKYGHYSTLLEELRTEDDALYDKLIAKDRKEESRRIHGPESFFVLV